MSEQVRHHLRWGVVFAVVALVLSVVILVIPQDDWDNLSRWGRLLISAAAGIAAYEAASHAWQLRKEARK